MKKKIKKNEGSHKRWVITIIILAFSLSIIMSFLSDVLLRKVNIIFMFIILIAIILLGVVFDILGVAVTVADEKPFHSMASSKVKGAKSSIYLIRHASRVSNVFCDVIGDICGIISGASAAYIVIQVGMLLSGVISTAVFSVILSGFVAALTIGGKAIGKDFAINYSKPIVIKCGKLISVFYERKN